MERFRRFRPLLFAIEFPWPSKYFSLKEKLKHWRSEVIARQFYWTHYEFEDFKLVINDAIQKNLL